MAEVHRPSHGYSVAVVEDDPRQRARLAMQLSQHRAAAFGSLAELDEKAWPSGPLVVVLGPSFANVASVRAIANGSLRQRPGVGVVLVAEEVSTNLLHESMRARIADVVPLDADPADLDEAVRRASEGLEPRWAPPPVDLPAAGGARGRVITVFSTKGGAGTSFLATNLAVALARRSDRPVVLVDADLQFGDVAVMLRLTPSHTVLNAVDEIASLDAAGMRSLLVRHPPSGLLALLAPVEPSYAEEVVPARMLQVVEVLASFASHVVIDTASRLDDLERELLSHADDIVLLAGMDLPSIKNLQIGVKALRNRGIPDSKTRLVLNRANSNVRLDVAAVERQLNMQADVLIPSDVVVPRSINLMEPVVLSAPRSKVARAVERLAGRFVAAPVEGTP